MAVAFLGVVNVARAACPRPFADQDADGDVDQVDFGFFQRCLTDGGGALDAQCACLDRDADGSLGAFDWDAFRACESGPSVPVDVACERWPSGLASDDFNTFNLDPAIWTIADPLGDSRFSIVGTHSGDARLVIDVPARLSHAIWTYGIKAPHVLQAAQNTDFQIETRLTSTLTQRYQRQGILIKQDDQRFMTFELYSEGPQLFCFIGAFQNHNVQQFHNAPVPGPAPAWLRVTRKANLWTCGRSADGSSWAQVAQFSHGLQVTQVGLFAANESNGRDTPPLAAGFDYFVNTAAPLSNEDGSTVADILAPNIHSLEIVPEADGAVIRWSTDEPARSVISFGTVAQPDLGSTGPSGFVRSHCHRIQGLTPGVEHRFRITSTDEAGNASQAPELTATPGTDTGGPDISVWYGEVQDYGLWGRPQPAADILGNASDPNGIAWLGYSLNGGPMNILSRGPNLMRLARPGDFAADLLYSDLLPGSNQLLMRAVDTLGNTRLRVVAVECAAPVVWPLPYGIQWSDAPGINRVAQVIDGEWTLGAAGVRTGFMAYDRLIGIGDVTWQNYEVTVPVTVHAVDSGGYDPPSNGPAVGILCHWPGHSDDGAQPRSGIYPLGGIGLYRWTNTENRFQIFGNNGVILAQAPLADVLVVGVTCIFKVRVQAEGDFVVYRLKTWPEGEPEPAGWKLTAQQSLATDPGSGSAVLLAHHVDATFGDVVILPVGP